MTDLEVQLSKLVLDLDCRLRKVESEKAPAEPEDSLLIATRALFGKDSIREPGKPWVDPITREAASALFGKGSVR